MRSQAPPLLPIFRSRHQADLLAAVLLHPNDEFTVTELARRFGVAASTLHPEAHRLVTAGVFASRDVGRARLLRANSVNPLVPSLTQLVTLAFGPRTVAGEEFADLADVQLVLIYGSWAARYQGESGPPPNDIDVLVVGRPDRTAVYDAADRTERRAGNRVEPVIVSPERWTATADPLIRQIRSSPFVVVVDHMESSREVDQRRRGD